MVSRILLVALMGRENNPLYVRSFAQEKAQDEGSDSAAEAEHAELRYHFLAHISLDVFAARLPHRTADPDFGLLFVQDGMAMYGWMTNTGVKIVLGFASGEVIGSEIRSIFRALQYAYISLVCNPFYSVDERRPISSRKFEANVARVVDAWNGTTTPQVASAGSSVRVARPVDSVIMSYSDSRPASPAVLDEANLRTEPVGS